MATQEGNAQQPANEATLINDCITAIKWMSEDAHRSLIGALWVQRCNDLGWTRGHRHAVELAVRDEIANVSQETAEQARARIVASADSIRQEAAMSGDYGPAVSALKLQADLLVPKIEQHQHVHAHFVAEIPALAKSAEEWEKQA